MITEGVVNIDTLTATTGTCWYVISSSSAFGSTDPFLPSPNDYSTLVGSAFFDGERCTSKISSAANITVTSNAKQGIGYTTTVLSVRSGDGLNAYGLAMQWQPATSTSSSGASTVSATSTSSSNPTNASNSNDNNQSSGLSSGAKAGIGVGVSVGALAIIGAALAVFFLRRRKGPNASRSIVASNQGYGGYIEGSSELGTEHKSPGQLSAETAYGGPPLATQQQGYYDPVPQHNPLAAGNGWQQEPQQHELAGGHEMHELDGGRRVQS